MAQQRSSRWVNPSTLSGKFWVGAASLNRTCTVFQSLNSITRWETINCSFFDIQWMGNTITTSECNSCSQGFFGTSSKQQKHISTKTSTNQVFVQMFFIFPNLFGCDWMTKIDHISPLLDLLSTTVPCLSLSLRPGQRINLIRGVTRPTGHEATKNTRICLGVPKIGLFSCFFSPKIMRTDYTSNII